MQTIANFVVTYSISIQSHCLGLNPGSKTIEIWTIEIQGIILCPNLKRPNPNYSSGLNCPDLRFEVLSKNSGADKPLKKGIPTAPKYQCKNFVKLIVTIEWENTSTTTT